MSDARGAERGVVVYDDATARRFAPFALTRPVAALRAGAELIGARWRAVLGAPGTQFVSSPHLDGFAEGGLLAANGVLAPGTLVANSRAVVALGARTSTGDAWTVGGEIAAVRLGSPMPVEAFRDGSLELGSLVTGAPHAIGGRWLSAIWDVIGQLPEQLADDTQAMVAASGAPRAVPPGVFGGHAVIVEDGATIEPHVVFDATLGAIVVRAGAHVCAFTRLAGPCVIGPKTHVLGGRVGGSAIGAECRVHGDVSASVFVGHANKAHEGFVGHSLVGCWANLGAGTTTSNLKNSYGAVRLWTPEGDGNTGLTFLGSLIGDHAKLGIGTMLGTGSVIGAGANVYGARQPPKRVPPFAWGDAPPYETFALDKFLAVAERVMSRRNVALDDGLRGVIARAHAMADTGDW